jgi:hypothetical protein
MSARRCKLDTLACNIQLLYVITCLGLAVGAASIEEIVVHYFSGMPSCAVPRVARRAIDIGYSVHIYRVYVEQKLATQRHGPHRGDRKAFQGAAALRARPCAVPTTRQGSEPVDLLYRCQIQWGMHLYRAEQLRTSSICIETYTLQTEDFEGACRASMPGRACDDPEHNIPMWYNRASTLD